MNTINVELELEVDNPGCILKWSEHFQRDSESAPILSTEKLVQILVLQDVEFESL